MNPTDQITLSSRDLSVGYRYSRRIHTLQSHLSVALHSSELIALIGPNGSGKSTLLRTLAGFEKPLAGEVMLQGRPFQKFSRNQWARSVSVVLTEWPQADKLTVSSLVGTGRSPYTGFAGRLTSHDRQTVIHALSSTGIQHLKNEFINRLSDGEKQRALIAKSLAQDTPVILLDEPAAFLDFPGRIRMMHLLRQLAHQHHKSILITTHDIGLALQYADTLWMVSTDKPLITGIPEILALNGKLGEYFAGQQVDFDVQNGKFLYNTPPLLTIRLEAPDPLAYWLTHALNRLNIAVTTGTGASFSIKTNSDQSVELWNLQHNLMTGEWKSIAQFLEHLTFDLFTSK